MCGEDRGMGLGNSVEGFSYISKNFFLNCIMGTQVFITIFSNFFMSLFC